MRKTLLAVATAAATAVAIVAASVEANAKCFTCWSGYGHAGTRDAWWGGEILANTELGRGTYWWRDHHYGYGHKHYFAYYGPVYYVFTEGYYVPWQYVRFKPRPRHVRWFYPSHY
jgi:opacity protein-like surface antigen